MQLIGLNWLVLMHKQSLNGILADEMGLGKTIQTIAFLAHLKETGEEGPHLIVVPSSTMDNWRKELELWAPGIEVVTYWGSQDERRHLRLQLVQDELQYDVILTTYNMVVSVSAVMLSIMILSSGRLLGGRQSSVQEDAVLLYRL